MRFGLASRHHKTPSYLTSACPFLSARFLHLSLIHMFTSHGEHFLVKLPASLRSFSVSKWASPGTYAKLGVRFSLHWQSTQDASRIVIGRCTQKSGTSRHNSTCRIRQPDAL